MIFLATLFSFFALQQDGEPLETSTPTAEAVIDRFVAAKGGPATIREIRNYALKGSVVSKGRILGTFESYQAAGRHLSIDHFPDGRTRQHGTDGKLAWQIDVSGEPSILKGQEARDYIRHYETLHESLEWKKQYTAILYAGKKEIQSTSTHHLIFVAKDNRQINRYFSIDSGFLIREEQVNGTEENTQILVSEIGNYTREKNGTTVSRRRVNHFGSEYSVEYKVESIEFNTLAEKEIFAIPESVTKLIGKSAK